MKWYSFIYLIIFITIIIVIIGLIFFYYSVLHYKKSELEKYKTFIKNKAPLDSNTPILIITYDDRFHEYQKYSEVISKNYCQKFNIDYLDFSYDKSYDSIPPWWRKVFIMIDCLKKYNQYKYIIWIDKDACFLGDFDIRLFLDSYYYFFISRDPHYDLIHKSVFHSSLPFYVNTGIFIVENSKRGIDFMMKWGKGFQKKDWCLTKDKSCHLKYTFNDWKTNSKWSKDSFEQGYLGKLIQSEKAKNICIYSSIVLANDYYWVDFLVSIHLMQYDNKKRLFIFKKLLEKY